MNSNDTLLSSRRCKRIGSGLALYAAALMALHANSAVAACGSATVVANETELRAAITAFNAETTSPCVFTISLNGDIVLTTNDFNARTNLGPYINNGIAGVSLIIEGNGHTVAATRYPLSPDTTIRPFTIQPNTTVTMNDLTITNGWVKLAGPAETGGGIHNDGTLTLNRSTVAGNQHISRGGGIGSSGTLTVNQSTIANNVVPNVDLGGGIYAFGNGSQITLTNSTLSGNAQQAIYLTNGGLTLDSVTVKNNGYGLYIQESNSVPVVVNLKNSVLSGNGVGLPGDNCYFPFRGVGGRVLNDGGTNLVGNGQATCGIVDGVNGNITSKPDGLGPLADNGGPTQTHAPLSGSAVVDAGATTLVEDQRGQPRPLGPAADIGAVETMAQCLASDTWTVSNLNEWKDAIACFNGATTAGTYTIAFMGNFGMGESSPVINNSTAGVSLVIEGGGHILEGNGINAAGEAARLIEVAENTVVTINELQLTYGHTDLTTNDPGGAILNRGNLTLRRSTIDNSIAKTGSAIYITTSGTALIEDSTIARNGFWGSNPPQTQTAAVYSQGDLTMRNSTVSGNKATGAAGITADSGSLALDSVTVTANIGAGGVASGLAVGFAPTIGNSIFAGNVGVDLTCSLGTLSASHNLSQTATNCFTNGVNGNIVGADPLLGPLANNGGPTKTHALLTGSPAIDTGDTALTTDQRGHPRPSGPADDMGAFEVTQNGLLTIRKRANPADGRDFDFTLAGGALTTPINFQLDYGDSDAVNDNETFLLGVGQYTVTEADSGQMGSRLISCSDANGPLGSVTGNTLSVNLQKDEDIECTFFNEQWFTVKAVVDGSGGSVSCSPTQVWKGQTSTCTAVPDQGFQVKEWTGACADMGSSAQCYLSKIAKDQTSTVVFENSDIDNDGVPNRSDLCPNTPPGAVVDKNGCAIEQLCKCDQARNHGQYVSCITRTANAFVRAGLINQNDKGKIIAKAAQSQCGKSQCGK